MKTIYTSLFSLLYFCSFSQDIELVKTFSPNNVPQDIVVFNNKLFFSADDGINGRELWSSDGTANGTALFKDILTGGASSPRKLKVLNNKLYFMALESIATQRLALYVSDGTAIGTIKLTSLSTNAANITATNYYENLNNQVFFKNDINASGSELWITDGTVLGTVMLKDINVGNGSSNPDHFYAFNNKLFFNAYNGIDGYELWVSDGTYDGTTMVSPGLATTTINGPINLFNYNNQLFYNYDGELWSSDGTLTGTGLFLQVHPSFKSYPKDFVVYNSKLYFSAMRNGLANELFISNGTAQGTLPVLANMDGYNCSNITEVLGMMVYAGKSDLHGNEIWMSLGSSQDTRELKNINNFNNGTTDGIVTEFNIIEANGLAYFSGVQSGTMDELFVTDGTEIGTFGLEYINTVNYDAEPTELTFFNNTLFFAAKYLADGGLYRISGGTSKMSDKTMDYVDVFPNPTSGSISFNNLLENKNYNAQITDLSGKLIETFSNISTSNNCIKTNAEAGIYIIRIVETNSNTSFSTKLIICN